VLSPHPGRVRAELSADGLDHNSVGRPEFGILTDRIHTLLFGQTHHLHAQQDIRA